MNKKNSEPINGPTAQTTRRTYVRVDPNTNFLVEADTLTISGRRV